MSGGDIPVKATRRGFYGSLREEGEHFSVASDKEVGTWMERVGDAGRAADTGTETDEKPALIARAKELGIPAGGNWGIQKLKEAIAEAEQGKGE